MNETAAPPATVGKKIKHWQRLLPLLITAACFAYLYNRLNHAAAAEGSPLLPYLVRSFANVNWYYWLALMIPYCFFYLIFDSLVIWRVINWFNVKIPYADILPIRASAYILSLINEQVSKGAIALYLNRRDGVPGWEVGSSMLFIMFCECLPYDSLDRARLCFFLRDFSFIFQRSNWPRDSAARAPDLPGVSAGQSLALRSCDRVASAAGDRRCCRLYASFEAFRGLGKHGTDAGLSAGDIFWGGDARTSALGRDSLLGLAFPGQAWPDDSLRVRH